MKAVSARVPGRREILSLLLAAIYAGCLFQGFAVHWRTAEIPTPEFDGLPAFVPVDGTSVKYAVNTSSILLCVGREYYLLRDGAWFHGLFPGGPFSKIDGPPSELMENSVASVH